MRFEDFTKGQQEIITTLDAPLMVSAGAGSGKTATLTGRIAHALSPGPAEGGASFCAGVDEVMAITFTRKAAAELKARVKRELIARGRLSEALMIDDAWISTIHGMCARLLRENALELGIDPAFEVISEVEALWLRSRAYDTVIRELAEDEDGELRGFLRALGAGESGGRAHEVVEAICGRIRALPGGFDAVAKALPALPPGECVRVMVEHAERFLEACAALPKPTKTDLAHAQAMETALADAQRYLSKGAIGAFEDPAFDGEGFAQVLFDFPKTSAKYRTKDADSPVFYEYRQAYAQIAAEAEAALGARETMCAVELARRVDAAFREAKGPARLDNDDLLQLTYEALVRHPDLAEAYRRRFKMIMIDEFQDTDALQVALISALAQPGLSNVCTVGDAQQSIYRFRGADVNVFFGYRDRLRAESPTARFVSLSDNFRSHAEVLSLVDAVFGHPEAFGDEFLHLEPKGAINSQEDPLFENVARIGVYLADCRMKGPGIAYGRQLSAREVAKRFAALRSAGANASDMALLMGSMSNVSLYAEALRDEGFECLVAGGSTFAATPEIQAVCSLCAFFACQADDAAVYGVLAGPAFMVPDSALLALGSGLGAEGTVLRRALSQGFASWGSQASPCPLSEDAADRIDFAWRCLKSAQARLATQGLSGALSETLRASGWLMRLEHQGAQGQAAAGNLNKAIRMVRAYEDAGAGPREAAARFCEDCATLKLSPGSLSTTSSNFVSIMTIHASKGLEFSHVAVAELPQRFMSGAVTAENVGGEAYISLRPRCMTADQRLVANAVYGFAEERPQGMPDEVSGASSPGARMLALQAFERTQAESEARRLFYVALTRAVKSLFVSVAFTGNAKGEYKGCVADLHRALGWDTQAIGSVQLCDFGGKTPAKVRLDVLDASCAQSQSSAETGTSAFLIPSAPPEPPVCSTMRRDATPVTSYSALAERNPRPVLGAPLEEAQADEGTATALGTAFHRLAEKSILVREGSALMPPDDEAVLAQSRFEALTSDQARRLHAAVRRWFSSSLCERLGSYKDLQAEVPFMLRLEGAEGEFFLEGEIDALGLDGQGRALIVDYKTGGSPLEEPQAIRQKHLLQAQCYALAVLEAGASEVEADFVRVEVQDAHNEIEPQVQIYKFNSDDIELLRRTIIDVMDDCR